MPGESAMAEGTRGQETASEGPPAERPAGQYAFDFTGGELCLDFANTLGGSRQRPKERLKSYQDLLAWGLQAGILNDEDVRRLGRLATDHPRKAAAALAEAIALREALFRTVAAVIAGTPPTEEDLATLNAALPRALAHLRVAPRAAGCEWKWTGEEGALDRMLWPIARSAADLLVSSDVQRVRRCGGENCDWLFVDTTRNRSRRWCDMGSCGNRAKAKRHYARKKAVGHGRRPGGR
jgi:predicted RNA-binding Zn ribbon-like protein